MRKPSISQATLVRSVALSGGWLGVIILVAASWLSPSYYAATWAGLSLLFVLAAAVSPWKAFGIGATAAFGSLFLAFHWVPEALGYQLSLSASVAWPTFVVLVAYEAIPFGLIALLASNWLGGSVLRMLGIPVAWVALEAFWPKVFPWSFAHSQTDVLPLLQIAEVAGSAGISFVMVAVALIPAAYWRRATRKPQRSPAVPAVAYSFVALALLAGVLVFGRHRQHAWEAYAASQPALQIAIIQVDPSYTDSIEKMRERSLSLDEDVGLICWPESTLGNYCLSLGDFEDPQVTLEKSLPPLVDLQPTAGIGCPVLAGGKLFSPGANQDGPFFQASFLVGPDQTIAGRYLKRTLMPFGEYIPGAKMFPVLGRLFGLDDVFLTGNEPVTLELPDGAKVGLLMCYDDMVAVNARKSVAAGAEVLITLANGSAFENPLALEQHMRLALLRAVENRRYFARCAATGVSCIIAPTGEVVARVDTDVEATLTGNLALLDGRTAYNRFGFLFAPACLTITIVCSLRTLGHGVWRMLRRVDGQRSERKTPARGRVRVADRALTDSRVAVANQVADAARV